jgi:hypothetical protein
MPDINPYEPPKSDEPLKRAQVLKRGIGVATILLLTPVATVVACWGSCAAGRAMGVAPSSLIAFGPPLAVLMGLMIWASLLDRPRPGDPNATTSRVGIFLATPVAVFVAGALGFGLAALIVLTGARPGMEESIGLVALIAFWSPPGITLVVMLWVAWRAGRA